MKLPVAKLLKNEYVYSVVNKLITLVVSFAQSVLVARYLGASLRGVSTYISSIVGIGSIIVTFGIHQAYPYLRKNKGKDVFYNDFLTIVILLYASYMVIAVIVAIVFLESMELQFATVLIPIYGYSQVVAYICLIENPNARNTRWLIVHLIEVLYIVLLTIFTTRSFFSMISILLFSEAIKSVIYTIMLKPHIALHSGLFSMGWGLIKIGFLPMLALLMTTLNYKVDILMLRGFDFISEAQIGVYSIGMTCVDKIALIPDTLKEILISKLSKGADEHEVSKVCRLCFLASVVVCLLFLVFGKTFIEFFYGIEYTDAYQILMICSIGSIFVGYFKLIAQYNIINRKQIRNILLLSASIIINVALNYFLIPMYMLAGAAFASCVGYLITGVVFVIWFARSNRISLAEMILLQKSDFDFLKRGKNEK